MSSEYLCIFPFILDAMQARVLQSAISLGVIDALSESSAVTKDRLFDLACSGSATTCDSAGFAFLMQVLMQAGVVETDAGHFRLTSEFRRTLPFSDLMKTLLEFAELFAPDFFTQLPQLLSSHDDFAETAKLFALFNYGQCHQVTPKNCLQASRWMRLTTMLSRYEAAVCHQHYSFDRHSHMLDVGGNSGEFALQLCRREPHLQATVADLPVVCQVGLQHVSAHREATRIRFHPLDMRRDSLPSGSDLVTFKSVLHDWPDSYVEMFLEKTCNALSPGGRLLIFERQAWDFRQYPLSYGLLPVMLFFRSYRQPQIYVRLLTQLGMQEIQVQQISLDVPFMLITATCCARVS